MGRSEKVLVMTDFCEIVVDACPRPGLHRTLEFAHEMSRSFGAKLSVCSYAWPRMSMKDILGPSAFLAQEQTIRLERALATSRNVFDRVFKANKEKPDWCSLISEPSAAMQAHLLTADLLITDSSEEDACVLPNPAYLSLESGIPVLRLARQLADSRFSSVLIAWKNSSQARRAVHDAMPILMRADSVSVVGVGDEISIDRLDAVAEHLRRHKVKAHSWHIPNTAGDVCASLLTQAQQEGAQLIVSGAYSRSPLAERVLGGVTTSMLKNAEISWLMAH